MAASAQAEWTIVDCSKESGLSMGEGGTCTARRIDGKSASAQVLGYSQQYRFERVASGGRTSLLLQHAPRGGNSAGAFTVMSAAASEQMLRRMVGSSGRNWSSYQGFGDTGYMTYANGASSCVAVDHAGDGYAWVLRVIHCQATAISNPEGFVKALLGAVRVGAPGSTRNALGGTVKPLS